MFNLQFANLIYYNVIPKCLIYYLSITTTVP